MALEDEKSKADLYWDTHRDTADTVRVNEGKGISAGEQGQKGEINVNECLDKKNAPQWSCF